MPKSTKNRSREAPWAPKIDLGAPRALRRRPGSISERSRRAPGASQARPGGGLGCLEDSPGSQKVAQESLEPPRGQQNRPQVASESGKNREIVARLRRNVHSERFSIDFRSFFENLVFLKSHPVWWNNVISRVARRACSRSHARSKNLRNRPKI